MSGTIMRMMLALVTLAIAGCASAPAEEPAPTIVAAPVAPPRTLDWSQADCESMTWHVPVLASSLQPYLPSGFEPAETGTGTPIGVGQAATLGFRAVECSEGFGSGDLLHSIQSGFLFTPVLPPQDLREDRFATRYTFGWDVLVASTAWEADATGWGLPLHDGGALVGPTAQGWTGALAMDQVGSFTVTGRSVDGASAVDDHEARLITNGARGFALWDSAVSDAAIATGVGVWNVDPGSWVADVLATTQGAATFELATWNMPRATIHWPGDALGPVEQGEGTQIPEGTEPPLAIAGVRRADRLD